MKRHFFTAKEQRVMKQYVVLRSDARGIIENAMRAVKDKFAAVPTPPPPPAATLASVDWWKRSTDARAEADRATKESPATEELRFLPAAAARHARRTHRGTHN